MDCFFFKGKERKENPALGVCQQWYDLNVNIHHDSLRLVAFIPSPLHRICIFTSIPIRCLLINLFEHEKFKFFVPQLRIGLMYSYMKEVITSLQNGAWLNNFFKVHRYLFCIALAMMRQHGENLWESPRSKNSKCLNGWLTYPVVKQQALFALDPSLGICLLFSWHLMSHLFTKTIDVAS